MARRRREVFYCNVAGGGCGKYFQTYLRENFFGNYTIVCPNCGHNHFRVIKEGVVTDDRHNERLGTVEKILGLTTTLQDTHHGVESEKR